MDQIDLVDRGPNSDQMDSVQTRNLHANLPPQSADLQFIATVEHEPPARLRALWMRPTRSRDGRVAHMRPV